MKESIAEGASSFSADRGQEVDSGVVLLIVEGGGDGDRDFPLFAEAERGWSDESEAGQVKS